MKIRCLFLSLSFIVLQNVHAKEKLEAIPLNPVVKDSTLKVRLNGIPDLKEVYFKPKNGGGEVQGEIQRLNNGVIIGKLIVSTFVPGSYEYRIRVSRPSGDSDLDNSVSVDFINFKIDPALKVASPGLAGVKTLEGIDTDKDGVRDDIQRWILENYLSKPNTQSALIQLAKVYQSIILNSNNRELLRGTIVNDLNKAILCIAWIRSDYVKIRSELDGRMTNSEERFLANLNAQKHLAGAPRISEITNTPVSESNKFCSFNASKEQ